MHIVHFLNHSRKANGHVEVAVDLACEQVRQGHQVTFLAGPGNFEDCLTRNGVRFIPIADRTGPSRVLLTAWEVMPILRRLRPDVVHAHMVVSALAARAAQLICGFALVTTVHNSFDRQSSLMRVGDRAIAVSNAVKSEMAGKGIPEAKLRTVLNGTINGSRRPHWPASKMELQRPAIVTVAGLHARKGVNTLIDGFIQTRQAGLEAHLYIVGDGPDRARLEQQAGDSAFAQDIHFMGHMDDPRIVIAGADVFVLASLHEPCGLALIEARQMGCACIASNVGGIPEVLDFGQSGKLFAPSDAADLAATLQSVLSDPETLQKMRQAAQSGWQNWTVERMAYETVAVYNEALDRRGSVAPLRATAS
jgi:glycosyltransferase involved in cell wall biosynthesis